MSTVLALRTELQRRRGDWPALCQATGLSYSWLTKFAQGRIQEPGLSKIERLRAYVESTPVDTKGDDAGQVTGYTVPVAPAQPRAA